MKCDEAHLSESQLPLRPCVTGDPVSATADLYVRAERARKHSRVLMAELQRHLDDLERSASQISLPDLLQNSSYLRLIARLKTMPVIEQAKGIIIAESGCGEAEAFDMLRRASQRSNVPVRELATHIVACASHRSGSDQEPEPGAPRPWPDPVAGQRHGTLNRAS